MTENVILTLTKRKQKPPSMSMTLQVSGHGRDDTSQKTDKINNRTYGKG